VLGQIIGETLGYAFTAAFTVTVVVALRRAGVMPSWLAYAGYVAAVLIATGVVIPVFGSAGLTNFAGYVLWCVWLLALAVVLHRTSRRRGSESHLSEP
jgi:hypothetical protein